SAGASLAVVYGDVHAANAPPSRRHANEIPAAGSIWPTIFQAKRNCTTWSGVCAGGRAGVVVSGAGAGGPRGRGGGGGGAGRPGAERRGPGPGPEGDLDDDRSVPGGMGPRLGERPVGFARRIRVAVRIERDAVRLVAPAPAKEHRRPAEPRYERVKSRAL